jgi:hypothetical protein
VNTVTASPGQPAWVRAANAVIVALSALVILPVGLLALVMIEFLTAPGHPAPSVANIFLLAWAVLASLVSGLHLALAGIGIARPKQSGTLRMVAASVAILVTCPILWAAILGLL